MENFKTLKISQVVEMFNNDTHTRPANKSANQVVLNVCNLVSDKDTKVSCELTKGGTILNRGSVCECLVKLWLKDQKSAKKFGAGKVDMVLNGIKYEIKLSTSKGYATYNKKQNYKNLIFINQYGIYLTDGTLENSLVLDKCEKHIKDINMQYAKTLVEW